MKKYIFLVMIMLTLLLTSCDFDEDVNINGNLLVNGYSIHNDYVQTPDLYTMDIISPYSDNNLSISSGRTSTYNNYAMSFKTLNQFASNYITRMSLTGRWDRTTVTISSADLILVGYQEYRTTSVLPPSSPVLDGSARVYSVVGSDNLTDLRAKFPDGSVDIFAQETTELDSPIFTFPSGTECKLIMKKPHAGIIKFVALFPDGQEYVLKELNYHATEKINANIGCDSDLPKDWFQETEEEKAERIANEYIPKETEK